MLEIQTIKHLLKKDNYLKYRESIKPSKENEKYYQILDELQSSLGRDIDVEEYLALIEDIHLHDKIKLSSFGEDYLDKVCTDIKQRQMLYDLAVLSVDVAEGRKELDQVFNFLQKLDIKQTDSVDFVTDNLADILASKNRKNGLNFRLQRLQAATNGLRKGDFVIIFARPETGKTTFLASEITFFAEQCDRPILWFNNEERGEKVKERIYQSSLNYDIMQLSYDPEEAQRRFLAKTGGRIKVYDEAAIHRNRVEKLCRELNPSLIVFDQLDKIKGFKADRQDLLVGQNYVWARELAKGYCPVIGVCQASASGEGKKWLTMEDMSESKTSKPAEGDLIIGVGKQHDKNYDKIRYLNLVKNKLTGQHAQIECRIDQERARYVDI